jgi:hypothetical protein
MDSRADVVSHLGVLEAIGVGGVLRYLIVVATWVQMSCALTPVALAPI